MSQKTSERNGERAGWTKVGLEAFCAATGQSIADDGNEEVISDFLCDLRHYCDVNKLDFDALLERGSRAYAEETDTVCKNCGATFCGFDEGDDAGNCTECAEHLTKEEKT